MNQKKDENTERENKDIEVLQEELNISKEKVVTGKVTVHKTVGTEIERHKIPLMREEIDIERIYVNKEVDSMPKTRVEGDVTIIPIVREVAVVTKILMVMEEVHITKKISRSMEDVEVPIRKESIEIKRQDD